MECKNCELRQRQFYCEHCLRNQYVKTDVPRFPKLTHPVYATFACRRSALEKIAMNRSPKPRGLSRGSKAPERRGLGWRAVRSGSRSSRRGWRGSSGTTMPVRAFPPLIFHFLMVLLFFFPCEERERLRQLRESLAARRRTLSAARLVPVPPLDGLMAKETQELHALSTALARARSGLVQELVEVFHVVEVGGRPPIGGKAGTKGEWTIGDLILPVPGDIRRACVVLTCSTTDILVTFQVTPQTISTPSSRTPSISSGYSRFIWASNSLSRRNGREKNLGSVNRGSGLVTAGTLVVGPSMFIPFHFRSACGVYM
jgi:hypothetical protein